MSSSSIRLLTWGISIGLGLRLGQTAIIAAFAGELRRKLVSESHPLGGDTHSLTHSLLELHDATRTQTLTLGLGKEKGN